VKKESVSRVLQKSDEWHEQKDAAPCAFEVAVVTRARGSSRCRAEPACAAWDRGSFLCWR
jgi:hypothetical protein